jgi:hypothetical protein
MTVTVDEFRGAFPAFADPIKYPDAQISFYLTLGYTMHNADKWGNLLDFGVQLWTAHSLSMDAMNTAGGANARPGALAGNVTSMSADGVSWSRDFGSVMDAKAGHWNLTSFGLRWRDLMNLVGAGPLQVGAPDVYDAWLSGATQSGGVGWSGPWWNW